MQPDRWQQIERMCQAALQLEPSQRAAFLEEASGGDQTLRREVEQLLAQETKAEDFLEAPAVEAVARKAVRSVEAVDDVSRGRLGSDRFIETFEAR